MRIDGEALVMHAGDKPYVVSPTEQVDLASRGLTLEAVNGIVTQILPTELQHALDEFGAVQHELPSMPDFPGEHFTVVAARGGDDVWVEIRRRRIPEDDRVPDEFFEPTQTPPPAQPMASHGAPVQPVASAATPIVYDNDELPVEMLGFDTPSVEEHQPRAVEAVAHAQIDEAAGVDDDLLLPDESHLWPAQAAPSSATVADAVAAYGQELEIDLDVDDDLDAVEEAKREAERIAAEETKREAERIAAEEAERETARVAAAEEARREAERVAAEEEAKREAARVAAVEEARREAERVAAAEEARREAERVGAEEEAKREAERIAAEEAEREAARVAAAEEARREAERVAAEEEAKREAERIAAEEAEREAARVAAAEEARREAERVAAEEEAKREAERIAAEEAEHEAARVAAAEEARREAERVAAEEEAKREAERIAAEEAEREAARVAAAEEARREAERVAAEEEAKREAERIAAEEAEREAARVAAVEEARREAERVAAEEEAKREAERIAAEEAEHEAARVAAARREAERVAAEEEAKREAERIAAEEAEREAARVAAAEEAEREAARVAAAEEAEREAARVAAAEEARREAERVAAEEEAKREAERIAAEEAEREAARVAAAEEAEREAARVAAAEEAEREAARVAAAEEAEREAARVAAVEEARREAERVAAEEEAKREAERIAAEEAEREAARVAAAEEAEREAARVAAAEEARRDAERVAASAEAAPDEMLPIAGFITVFSEPEPIAARIDAQSGPMAQSSGAGPQFDTQSMAASIEDPYEAALLSAVDAGRETEPLLASVDEPDEMMTFAALQTDSVFASVVAPHEVAPLEAYDVEPFLASAETTSEITSYSTRIAPRLEADPLSAPFEAQQLPLVALPPSSQMRSAPLQPAVVLNMSRSPIRSDAPPPPVEDPMLSGLERLLRVSSARGASTLYLSSGSRPSVRVDGELQMLDGEPVHVARDVESLLLTLMPERSHEALRTGAATEWITDLEGVGRVRCMSFRDQRGPGGVFRLMPTRSVSADELGLPKAVQALALEQEGLILIAGARSSGKRTTMAAFVDLMNRTRRDHIITIEREINIQHERANSFISQREVRGNDEDVLAAARAALREDPDVLVIEELRTSALVDLALEAAAAGRLVVGGFTAHTATGAIDRIIDLYSPDLHRQVQMALADSMRGVVAQVLLRKVGGGRLPAREVLLNTAAVSSVIAGGKTSQLPMAIEGGRGHGMMPLNDALVGLVRNGSVEAREAYRHSPDRAGFVAALNRQGIDTSFAERLANG